MEPLLSSEMGTFEVARIAGGMYDNKFISTNGTGQHQITIYIVILIQTMNVSQSDFID